MYRHFLFLLFSGFLLLAPLQARAEAPAPNSEARLIVAVKGTDNLKTLQAGVDIKLNPGWKAYWRTPGEAGLAPVFNWDGSENFKSAKISWPAPTRFTAFDIDNFGYENEVVFPIEITPQEEGKPVSLQLKLDLLVCKDLCVPESHTLSLKIPAGEAEVSPDQPLLADALKKIPTTEENNNFMIENVWLDEGDDKKVYLHAYGISATAPSQDADLFVESKDFVSIGKPGFTYNAATTELQIQAPVRSNDTMDDLKKKLGKGPLTLTYVDDGHAYERHKNLNGVQKTTAAATLIKETQEHADPSILLLAFIGGLILNLMPCVLPVLSIKILSVLSHGGKDHRIHRWEIFRDFMAAAAGIVFSFWLIAGGLVALKNAGQTIGWGIQFQHPGFIVFLIAIVAFFSANMWGLFEIPLPRFIAKHLAVKHEHEPTLVGHFLTGVFATLLATPCSAPFLGTAISFALARQAADILIIFTVIGLGLASPYIVLALSPKLFKHMPKPGKWMVTLKKCLAALLALTILPWLTYVLITISTTPTLDDGWTKFDEALIAPAVEKGETVVVDVTADWCLTCKANKRLVFDKLDDALFVPNVLLLQADWTHHDETISAYLKKYGRYGIPFNIIYGPSAPQGIILSELPSRNDVLRALSEAAGE